MTDAGADYPTTIGADASFKGRLEFEKGARLLGKFEGEVKTKGELVVADNATFSGEAEAGNVRIEGEVKGNLRATGKVHLAASARLEGDIQSSRLEVVEGAVLVGHCTVGAKSDARAPVATKPVSAPLEPGQPPLTPPPESRSKDKPPAPVVAKK